jgi:hypothetical protein
MRFRKLDSFVEYLLVAQDSHQIEHYVRQSNNRWVMTEISGSENIVKLSSIGCSLNLVDIYEGISFEVRKEL